MSHVTIHLEDGSSILCRRAKSTGVVLVELFREGVSVEEVEAANLADLLSQLAATGFVGGSERLVEALCWLLDSPHKDAPNHLADWTEVVRTLAPLMHRSNPGSTSNKEGSGIECQPVIVEIDGQRWGWLLDEEWNDGLHLRLLDELRTLVLLEDEGRRGFRPVGSMGPHVETLRDWLAISANRRSVEEAWISALHERRRILTFDDFVLVHSSTRPNNFFAPIDGTVRVVKDTTGWMVVTHRPLRDLLWYGSEHSVPSGDNEDHDP